MNLVLVLDQLFVHRLRKLEAKEPALQRVREIAAAATTDSAGASDRGRVHRAGRRVPRRCRPGVPEH